MKKNDKIMLSVIIFIITLLIVTGITYAYFSANISGTEDDTTITVTGGIMNIHYNGGANIEVKNIVPNNTPFTTKTFTVTGNNTMDIEMYYGLSLVVEKNTFSEEALKYKLIGTNLNNNGFLIQDINELTNIGTGAKNISLGAGGFNSPTNGNKVHTYNLELYFPETNINQNIDQGKEFNARIEIIKADDPTKILNEFIIAQHGGIDTIISKDNPAYDLTEPFGLTYTSIIIEHEDILGPSATIPIGKGFVFDVATGKYSLTDHNTGEIYSDKHIGMYTCQSTRLSSDCSKLYKIEKVEDNYVTQSTLYISDLETSENISTGLFALDDDYGRSYYYRGNKDTLKNNLIWAGFQWKIVRINGDGSIRLIYNGTIEDFDSNKKVNNLGTKTEIMTSQWNSALDYDAKYVGYMFGGKNGEPSTMRDGDTSAAATYNETSTTIKTALDNWYKINILDKGYSSLVVDNLFCNERQLISEVGGPATGPGYGSSLQGSTYYASYYRLFTDKIPSIKCVQKNDRFTVNDTTTGNGSLTYPIGLLSADETSMAGFVYSVPNNQNFLYTNQSYWTMSPRDKFPANVAILCISSYGYIASCSDKTQHDIRPVLSLNSSVAIIGTGSSTDPFRVIK